MQVVPVIINIMRFGRPFWAMPLLFLASNALAEKPLCPGLLPSTVSQARFISADPERADFVRKSLADMDAVFSDLRKPARLAVCLVPEFREDMGLADAGFVFIPTYANLSTLANARAVLFHEYGHHLFYLNIGRYAPAFARSGDLSDQFAAVRIDLRALENQLFELAGQEKSAEYRRLKESQTQLESDANAGWVMLMIGQYLVADLSELMADVAAVLMLADASAVRKAVEELSHEPHPERDFATVEVSGLANDSYHGRLWPVRQAIGRLYLNNLDLKKRGEVYHQIMAAMGRGLNRLMNLSFWTGDVATRNRIFIEELEKR